MHLHKCSYENKNLFTLFDSRGKVAVFPTRYLNYLRIKKRSSKSIRQIAYVIKSHCEWFETDQYLQQLTVDESLEVVENYEIVKWINFQRESGKAENTIHNREVLVREMYKWFTTEEASVRKDTPWDRKYMTKQQHKKIPRFMTPEQVINLLLGMHNESQRALAHCIYDTGVRVSELIRLERKHLPDPADFPAEFNYYPLRILGSKSYDGGEYKIRDTIISRPMLARIRRYHETPEYKLAGKWKMNDSEKPIFLNVRGKQLSENSVYKTIKTAWARRNHNSEEASPHRLRHGTAYSVLQSELGGELLDNLLLLKSMFGHEDIKTTEIYSNIPIIVIRNLAKGPSINYRYEEADQIYQATYLPSYKNIEKRGRKSHEEEYEAY